jgi:hypothetical protein
MLSLASSATSRAPAACQPSPWLMKPPGRASWPLRGGMLRRTTSSPASTGTSTTATGSGLRYVLFPHRAQRRGHGCSGVKGWAQNEQ